MDRSNSTILRDVLAPQLISRGVTADPSAWTLLHGGRTNRIWRITARDTDLVVKLYAENRDNPLFPNDPASEARVLRHLDGHDIAPRLLDHLQTSVGYCLIYAHLKGTPWRSGMVQAARLLRRLHHTPPPEGLRRLPDGSAALAQQTRAIISACPAETRRGLLALEPMGAVQPAGRSCLLHGDPVTGNMIAHAGTLRLIDWQCPGIGDPCEDLSLFLSPAMQMIYRGQVLSPDQQAEFLDAYADHATLARYRQIAPWYHWRMLAYCRWKEGQGDTQAPSAVSVECAALLDSKTDVTTTASVPRSHSRQQ